MLEISSNCVDDWDSHVLSGEFQAVGSFRNHTIYTKRTIDENEMWWFFFHTPTGWRFSYSRVKTIAGVSLWGTTVTPLDMDTQGQFLNNYDA